ncbi:MAG TPA: hypothetical protein VG672_29545 [Bryobacteraceae bacterium]|nr:hypothetical protein [Bryobacteraceae bacterium]
MVSVLNNGAGNRRGYWSWVSGLLVAWSLIIPQQAISQPGLDTLVLTSTNDPAKNSVAVFKLETRGTPSLSLVSMVPTGGIGGASGNAGGVQFGGGFGAVVNYGSNNVSKLFRIGNFIGTAGTVNLASGCTKPVSVAIRGRQLFVAGANCAESHAWPSGFPTGSAVSLPDTSTGQIVVGDTWAAVTMKSGSVLQLPLTAFGALNGNSAPVSLPSTANDTPLGAAFWGDLLAFNPAHSPDSFALVNKKREVFPVTGPQPPYPANAPCWLAKGPGNIWYSGNSPGQAISIFFSDGRGGTFYKSVPVPGTPTDLTVSRDNKWLAVIYTAADGSGGRVAVFAIDAWGDLSPVATSDPAGVASFNGVAFAQ